jgi:pyruvate,orthophosphate dikinase
VTAPETGTAAKPASKTSLRATDQPKHVYSFGAGSAEGNARMRDLLGGKGAGLAEMTNAGIPVPPGYTITTAACRQFFEAGGRLLESTIQEEREALRALERYLGRRLGDPENPLLVSVRSGAPVSMPGMMDTVLNLGLNDQTVPGLAQRSGHPRFAHDSYRRFIQMYSDVVLGVPRALLEKELQREKARAKVELDVDLSAERLEALARRFLDIVRRETGRDFPQDPRVQLAGERDAVFR